MFQKKKKLITSKPVNTHGYFQLTPGKINYYSVKGNCKQWCLLVTSKLITLQNLNKIIKKKKNSNKIIEY